MPDDETAPSFTPRLLIALATICFGLLLALSAFDIGLLDSGDINGPPWLAIAAGGTLIAAGCAVLAGKERPLSSSCFALLVLLGLAAIGNWIAFGVGARTCGASIWVWQGELDSLACRAPFGIGALIANACIVLMIVSVLQTALGGPPRLERLVHFAGILVLATLLPIIVPLVVILLVGRAWTAVKTRAATGAWPRNEAFIARTRAQFRQKFGKKA